MRLKKHILISLLYSALVITLFNISPFILYADSDIIIKEEVSDDVESTEISNINLLETANYFNYAIDTSSAFTYSSDSVMTMSLDSASSGVDLLSSKLNYFIVTHSNSSQLCTYDQSFYIGTHDVSQGSYRGRTWSLSFDENFGSSSSKIDATYSSNDVSGNLTFKEWKLTSGSTSTTYPNNTIFGDTGIYSKTSGGILKYQDVIPQARAYNLSYNDNATVTMTAQWNSTTIGNFDTLTMPGYSFKGWYTASSGGTKTTSVLIEPATTAFSQTLYAQWSARNYTFAFDYNKPVKGNSNPTDGGSKNSKTEGYNSTAFANSASNEINKGADTAVYTFDGKFSNLPTPTLTGWTFGGWYLMDNTGKYHKVENGTDFNYEIINRDKTTLNTKYMQFGVVAENAWTLVARWIPNTYSIIYTGNYNTSGNNVTVNNLVYDVEYKILKNTGTNNTNFARKHKLTFDENGGTNVNDLTVEHTFTDWLLYSVNSSKGSNTLYSSLNFNSTYNSSRNHLYDTYEKVGIPYWASDSYGKRDIGVYTSNYYLGEHFSENETFKNLCAINNGTVELKAQWKINRVKLPDTEKTHFKFLSWYLEDLIPSSISKGDNLIFKKSTLLGNAGDSVYILQDTTAYAWFNQAPIFTDIYEGQFFEGQNVSVADLLSLVSVYDYEDDYYNAAVKAIYNLPSVNQSQIYVPIHTDADIDDENPDVAGDVDGTIYNDTITIDGIPYRFNSENWEKTTTDGIYKNKTTGRFHYTVEAKMALEEDINASNLVLRIKSIEYEYKDGVVQTIWDSDSDFTDGGKLAITGGIKVDYNSAQLKMNVLDTSTGRFPTDGLVAREDPYTAAKDAVGKFKITYQVTDNGVWNGDTLVDEDYYNDNEFSGYNTDVNSGEDATTKIMSAITLEYTRLCSIQYNNVPLIYLRDVMLYEGSEDWDSIIDKQIVIDAEDCIHNPPFWYKTKEDNTTGVKAKDGYTYDNLQTSLYEVGIWGCVIDDAFLVDYPNAQSEISKWEVGKSTRDLKKLKDSNSLFMNTGATGAQIYSAILKFNVEFDSVDQWGKHSNGTITDNYYAINRDGSQSNILVAPKYSAGQNVGVKVSSYWQNKSTEDYWQTQIERSITVYKVNTDNDTALVNANTAEKVRYINLDWLLKGGISSNSYWGDNSGAYGYNVLLNVFKAKENINGLDKKTYTTVTTNKNGDKININIEDYTSN